jgi:hypothetical protein
LTPPARLLAGLEIKPGHDRELMSVAAAVAESSEIAGADFYGGKVQAIILRSAGGAVGVAMLRTLTCTSGTGRSTDMVDEMKKCEARSCGKASLDSIAP